MPHIGQLSLIDILWKISLQAGILAALVWLVTTLAKSAPAWLRHLLWVLVLIKFLVPPLAHLPADWACWHRAPVTVSAAPRIGSALRIEAAAPPSAKVSASASIPQAMPVTPSRVSRPTRSLPAPADLLFVAWLVGACAMLALLGFRLVRQEILTRRSVPADGELAELLSSAALRMRVKKVPRLRVSGSVFTPTLVGAFRPLILLPTDLASGKAVEHLETMLLHELAHVKRWDIAIIWLYQLTQILFFFHPAVWLVGREMRKEGELACDELAVSVSRIRPRDYAAGYVAALKLAENRPAAVVPLSLGMAEPFEIHKRRLEMMLRTALPKFSVRWAAVLALIAAAGLPTFAGFRVVGTSAATATASRPATQSEKAVAKAAEDLAKAIQAQEWQTAASHFTSDYLAAYLPAREKGLSAGLPWSDPKLTKEFASLLADPRAQLSTKWVGPKNAEVQVKLPSGGPAAQNVATLQMVKEEDEWKLNGIYQPEPSPPASSHTTWTTFLLKLLPVSDSALAIMPAQAGGLSFPGDTPLELKNISDIDITYHPDGEAVIPARSAVFASTSDSRITATALTGVVWLKVPSTHAQDLSPAELGAIVQMLRSRLERLRSQHNPAATGSFMDERVLTTLQLRMLESELEKRKSQQNPPKVMEPVPPAKVQTPAGYDEVIRAIVRCRESGTLRRSVVFAAGLAFYYNGESPWTQEHFPERRR